MERLGAGCYGSEDYLYCNPFMYELIKMIRTTKASCTRYFSFPEEILEVDVDNGDASDPHALKNVLADLVAKKAKTSTKNQSDDKGGDDDIKSLLRMLQGPTNCAFYVDGEPV